MLNRLSSVVLAALVVIAPGALAQTSGSFDCITDNSAASCAQGESTLSWGWDGSNLTIANNGSGYVAEVYFDLSAGMAASFNAGLSSGGVLFSLGASPGALPGGNTASFASEVGFDSDRRRGRPVNGINGGEFAVFSVTGASLSSMDAGALLAGIHVRSLYNGQSEGFVTTPVPEPSTYALMLAGLGALGFVARRRRQR
jgi:hypothetical protein